MEPHILCLDFPATIKNHLLTVQRAGFALESTLRNNGRNYHGALRHSYIFSQIRPD
jgi:hypothetical protein